MYFVKAFIQSMMAYESIPWLPFLFPHSSHVIKLLFITWNCYVICNMVLDLLRLLCVQPNELWCYQVPVPEWSKAWRRSYCGGCAIDYRACQGTALPSALICRGGSNSNKSCIVVVVQKVGSSCFLCYVCQSLTVLYFFLQTSDWEVDSCSTEIRDSMCFKSILKEWMFPWI